MDIRERSLKLARQLFNPSLDKEQHHFTFLFRKNKLISIGSNDYNLNAKALYFAERFNVEQKKQFPSLHSEISSISRIWGKVYIDRKIRLVNVKFTKAGQIGIAKPCKDCQEVLSALGIEDISWTKINGEFNECEY